MKREYENTQREIGIAIRQSEELMKFIPSLLKDLKQSQKDLSVVEYDAHRGDGVSEREYKAIQKRFENLVNKIAKTGVRRRCRLLREAYEEIEESSYLVVEEIEKASPGRVANRYAYRLSIRG
jgi:hypothetical protein